MGGQQLDTRNPTSKLMLTILAGVATWEREIMLERQREGIAKARKEGKYRGRAPTVARQAAVIREAVAAGEKPTAVAARLGIARSSVYRMLTGSPAAEKVAPIGFVVKSWSRGDVPDLPRAGAQEDVAVADSAAAHF